MTEEKRRKLLYMAGEQEPFLVHNGIRLTDVDDGSATAVLHLQPVVMNPWGLPHGGVLFSMGDVACGIAAMTLRSESLVTINASIDYMDGASPEGDVTVVAKVERMGGKVCFCTAEYHDCHGKRIAMMRAALYFTGHKLDLE